MRASRESSDIQKSGCWNEYFGEEFRYTWTLHKYADAYLSEDICIESISFTDDLFQKTWKLRFYPMESRGPDQDQACLSLQCQQTSPSGGKELPDALICLNLLDSNGSIYTGMTKSRAVKTKIGIADEIFFPIDFSIPGHSIRLVNNGCLKILLRMWNYSSAVRGEGIPPHRENNCAVCTTHKPESSLKSSFKWMRSDTTYSDFTIYVDSYKFPTHKAVLAARSDVFRNMLAVPMAEKENNCLTIKDFTKEVVNGMLEYIYTDTAEIKPTQAKSFIEIANLYQLERLKYEAEIILGKNLSLENAVEAFQLSILYKSPMLKSVVTNYIVRNKTAFISNSSLEEFAKTNLKDVLEIFSTPETKTPPGPYIVTGFSQARPPPQPARVIQGQRAGLQVANVPIPQNAQEWEDGDW